MTSGAKGPTAPQAHAVCNARVAKHEAVVAVVVDLEVAVVSSRPLQVDEKFGRDAEGAPNGTMSQCDDEPAAVTCRSTTDRCSWRKMAGARTSGRDAGWRGVPVGEGGRRLARLR